MQDMVGTFVENVQALLSQCRDLENNHHEKMMEIAIVTLEKVIKNELDDEISDDLKMVKYILCAPEWSFFTVTTRVIALYFSKIYLFWLLQQELLPFNFHKYIKQLYIKILINDFNVFQLLVDKDTIINAVSSSHDVHLLKIDNKEDDIVTRINQSLKNLIEQIHQDEEITRNRMRVSEINNLIDHLREEIDNLEVMQN